MPKLVDHDERRSALASAAAEAIATQGLERVKLVDIGRAAGVTTGALAHYFRDRDAVLVAAFDHVAGELFSGLGASTKPLRFRHFSQMLPLTAAAAERWNVWLAFCGRVPYEADLAEVYDRYYEAVESGVATRLGILDRARARSYAGSLVAAVDGVGMCATVQPRQWPPKRQIAALRALIGPILDEIEAQQDSADRSQ